MSDHSNIPANHEELNARDVNLRETGVIFAYTVILSAVFFGSVFAVYIYFRWELDAMREERSRIPQNATYENIKAEQEKALGKVKLNIENAMAKTVQEQGGK